MSKYSEKIKRRQEAEQEKERREAHFAKLLSMFMASQSSITPKTAALKESVLIEATPAQFSKLNKYGSCVLHIAVTDATVQLLGRIYGESRIPKSHRSHIAAFSIPVGGRVRVFIAEAQTSATDEGQPTIRLKILAKPRTGKFIARDWLCAARASPLLLKSA